jgi:glycogen synthase
MMKILMISWELPPVSTGGGGIAVEGIIRSLFGTEAEISILLPWFPTMIFTVRDAEELVSAKNVIQRQAGEKMFSSDREVFSSVYSEGPENGFQFDGELKTLWQISEAAAETACKCSFDIIHCHDWITVPCAFMLRERGEKPLIFHIHSLEIDRNPFTPIGLVESIEQMGCTVSDKIIAVSRITSERIQTSYHVEQDKIGVIHNGYFIPPLGPNVYNKSEYRRVLFVGRLTHQKNPNLLLDAAKNMVHARDDVEFIFIGWGSLGDELTFGLQQELEKERIRFTGMLSHKDSMEWLRTADILVLPSVFEPFGIVALEAISLETAVITHRQAGVAEVAGSLVCMDTMTGENIGEAISYLLDNMNEMNRIKKQAAAESRSLDWYARRDEFLALYRKLCF